MESGLIGLSKYRLNKARTVLKDAELLYNGGSYASSVNRSYYALFHCLRSVTALDNFDSSKHSGIIAFFNRTYIKTGIFAKDISKILDKSFRTREKADYEDFTDITEENAREQLENTKYVFKIIESYVTLKW